MTDSEREDFCHATERPGRVTVGTHIPVGGGYSVLHVSGDKRPDAVSQVLDRCALLLG
jgi:hypothetical protein